MLLLILLEVIVFTIFGVIWVLPACLIACFLLPFIFRSEGSIIEHCKNAARIFFTSVFDTCVSIFAPVFSLIGLLIELRNLETLTDRNLPKWMSWFDNYKDPIGDIYWRDRTPNNKSFTKRLEWLIRNPANNWSYGVMGWTTSSATVYNIKGDTQTSDQPAGHSGILYVNAFEGKNTYPCYYIIKQWGNSKLCIRIYLGWKNKGLEVDGRKVQFVNVVNPFKNFVIQ